MEKSVRLTKANATEQWNLSDARFAKAKAKGSTGEDGKARERDFRDMSNVAGITYSGDLKGRSINRGDITTHDAKGNMLTLEVKHGGGAIAYAEVFKLEEFSERTPEMCLKGVDWVIYCDRADITDRHEMAKTYRVCTREDFIDMLIEYCHGPKAAGFLTATKFSKGCTQINIQSKYVKQFWDGMRNDPRTMSYWTFCYTVLGRKPRWNHI